ncbi:MAG: T9SS type A sorting domain-containing protein, partial [Ignavibacteria bacterium]|nr:T9SS type A sorting domain-containing protein [Ignavibacteria bacterium]
MESSIPYSEQSNFYVQLFDGQHDAVSEPLKVNNSTSALQNDFEFYGLNSQTNYTLKLWEKTQSGTLGTSWLWNNWGGTTALDALIISYMVINSPIINPFPWLGQPPLYSALFREVADVSNNLQLTALDALILNYRSVGFPDMAPFPGGRHNFQVAGDFMDSINQSIYPNSPEIIFEPNGAYLEATIDTTVYYSASLEQLQNTENQLNIYITATGDVNASLNFQNTKKTIGVQELDNDFNYIENQQISIPFYFNKSVNLAAFSIELAYDTTKLELISLEGIDIYTVDKEHGIVKLVWLDQKGNWFSKNEPVFSIVAKIKGELNDQSPFRVNLTKTEFVTTEAIISPTISLKIPKLKKFSETDQFITNHYCVPNPFSDQTNLYFSLETEGQVELKIKDISGKIIYTSDLLTFTNGQHPIQISKSVLSGNGIYIYT